MTDSEDFAEQTERFRRELLAHCYRMLGSVQDAEDLVQETYLLAWRGRTTFEGRSSLRTWLYRIATNVCLKALEHRSRRPLPSGLGGPGDDPHQPLGSSRPEVPWLQPLPDALVSGDATDPAMIAVARAGTRLALIAALQYLPARQRAILILRDVLGWRAAEVAAVLATTTAAVNSGLQRARAQLTSVSPAADGLAEPAETVQRALLDRYATAFARRDIAGLTALLTEDVVWEMPPIPVWFAGRDRVGALLGLKCPAAGGSRLVPAAANGQHAFAMYAHRSDGLYHAHSLQVFTFRGSLISRVTAFHGAELFTTFRLPQVQADVPVRVPVP
ncbi:MAG: polymerase, sigma-24 subunit, subfamily [Amycolatopsis sp.]|jgi:RNA polymerase sigma-70 factor (ECF subfamily)|uniref:sigma-70 family RNA polymerase sigma factor n=1 Tax=Amycolatopsis sp. TaxID=37632 RepID=UPI00261A9FB1|nr:sigma-70 family RNA polymerase sigma factor [Amycolatopsis sp.]MCU1686333.1 polymerase, sigma-24 subunit, subfamily [Amycolatopsis sp.]